MYIKSIYIENFGMLSDLQLNFGQGLNIIEGDNETGKSTISMFIKFVFYGLSNAEREKYVPWGKSGCRGELVLVENGKEYKIERTLTLLQKGAKDSVIITDESLAPVFREQSPADVFLGVSERVFLSTSFVGQISGAFVESAKITEAVENLLFSADETTNTDKALKKLDEQRVSLLYKNKKGGEIYELETKIAEYEQLFEKAQTVNAQIFELQEKIRVDRAKCEENSKGADEIESKCTEYEAYVAIATKGKCIEQGEKAEEAKKAFDEKKQALSVDGKLPDGEYIARLQRLSAEIKSLKTQLTEAEESFKNAESSLDLCANTAEIIDKMNDKGGEHGLISSVESLSHKIKSQNSGFVIALILGILFLAAAVASFIFKQNVLMIAFLGAFVLCTVLFVVFALGKSKTKKQLFEFCSEFDCDSPESLLEFLSSARADELMITKKRADIESAGNVCQQLMTRIKEKESLVKEYTKEYSAVEPKELDEEIQRIDLLMKELDEAEKIAETERILYENLKTQTEKIDIEEEKKKIRGVLKTSEIAEFDKDEQKRRCELLRKSAQFLSERILENEKTLASISANAQNPAEIFEILSAMKKKLAEDKLMYNALMLAYEKLEEGSRTLRSEFCPKLAKEAGRYMQAMTDGAYDLLGIDYKYTLSCRKDNGTHSIDNFSWGTQDIAYISLRVALVSTLFRAKTPPLVFDDTFAHADDGRLLGILAVLSSLGRREDKVQSIVFTCHKREGQISSALPETNIIRMKKQNG